VSEIMADDAEPIQWVSRQAESEVQFKALDLPAAGERAAKAVVGYRRWQRFDQDNSPGQDCAGIQADGEYVVGVAVDGVSQSFYAQIAAEAVCCCLLQELWKARQQPPDKEGVSNVLAQLSNQVHPTKVETFPIPELMPLIKGSEEEKQRRGSQAVFAAFVLNRVTRELHLYRVGDPGAVVYHADREPEVLRVTDRSLAMGRWSSTGKVDLRLQTEVFSAVTGCLVCSDGVPLEWVEGLRSLPGREEFERLAETRSESDDLSLVVARCVENSQAVSLLPPAPVGSTVEQKPTMPAGPPATDAATEASSGRAAVGAAAGTDEEMAVPSGGVRKLLLLRLHRASWFRFAAALRYAAIFAAGAGTAGWCMSRSEPSAARRGARTVVTTTRASIPPAPAAARRRQAPPAFPPSPPAAPGRGRLVLQIRAAPPRAGAAGAEFAGAGAGGAGSAGAGSTRAATGAESAGAEATGAKSARAEAGAESADSLVLDSSRLQRAELYVGRLRLSLTPGEIRLEPPGTPFGRGRVELRVLTVEAGGKESLRRLRLDRPTVVITVR
jgi:hypothetical protein